MTPNLKAAWHCGDTWNSIARQEERKTAAFIRRIAHTATEFRRKATPVLPEKTSDLVSFSAPSAPSGNARENTSGNIPERTAPQETVLAGRYGKFN